MSKAKQARGPEITAKLSFDTFFNEYQIAELFGVSVATVRRWRLLRQGPKYIKLGASVRYKPEDLNVFIAALPTGGGQEVR
jgi:hypothetical protein